MMQEEDAGQRASEDSPEETSGMSVTAHQIRDIYMAGTSDGILILENGQTRNAKDNPQLANRRHFNADVARENL